MLLDGGDRVDASVAAVLLGGISACDAGSLPLSAGPDMVDEPAGRALATDEQAQAGSPVMGTVFVRAGHSSPLFGAAGAVT